MCAPGHQFVNSENEEMIVAVNAIYVIAWRSLKKIQDFNGVWTCDLTIPVRCSTNWAMKPLTSIVGSYVPVKEMSVNDIWNK